MDVTFVRALTVCLVWIACLAADALGQDWPQASGPNGNYLTEGPEPPERWSVSTGENVLWRQELPECGQSGIAVFGDKLFLTIKKPLADEAAAKTASSADQVGLCLDARTGKTLWSVPIPGKKPTDYALLFISEQTPIADSAHVWFSNSSGGMICVDHSGKEIWRRVFDAEPLHNAKFCQPMLVDGKLIDVELKEPLAQLPSGGKNSGQGPWTYLRAFDPLTGNPLWVADGGTSIFSTPGFGKVGDDWVVLHGRGGAHNPPERPYGFTLSRAANGQALWTRAVGSGFTFFVSCLNDQHAYAFDKNALVSLNIKTGQIDREIDLKEKTEWYRYNPATKAVELHAGVQFGGKTSHPSYHSNLLIGKYMLFMSHEQHAIARVNLDSGKVEYLQVPIEVERKTGTPEHFRWEGHTASPPENSRGMKVQVDSRTHGDGWGHLTVPAPIAVNGKAYFVTMLGTVYVVDANASAFDAKALKWVGDLGQPGHTWTLASLSYANGCLYARTLKDIVCIGNRTPK